MAIVASSPAAAQVSGSATIASEGRFRGRSISDGDPILSIAVADDVPGGWYVDAAAMAAIGSGRTPRLVNGVVDAGYAWRDTSGRSFDIGLTRQQFARYARSVRASGYTEAYAGISGRIIAARIAYSPDYFGERSHTLYASVDAAVHPLRGWSLVGHAGALTYLSRPLGAVGRPVNHDESISVARRVGLATAALTVSTAGPGPDVGVYGIRSRTAIVASGTIAF